MADIEDVIWVESGRSPDGGPLICRLTWGSMQWSAPTACVAGAAADLYTAAAYADLTEQVFAMGMPAEEVGELLGRMLGPRIGARKHAYRNSQGFMLGCQDVFGVSAGGSSAAREGVVILCREDETAYLDADEARKMAGGFFMAVDACESDTLIDAVLRESGLLDDDQIALVFELAMAARGERP